METQPLSPVTDVVGRTRALRRAARRRRAVVALEFGLVAPVFLLMMFGILGAGLDGFYQLSVDDAVRDAARQIQIAGAAGSSGASFVTAVCAEFGFLAKSCSTRLTYDIQANVSPAAFASLVPVALPANGKFANVFPAALAASANVLIQASYPLPIKLPMIGAALTLTGTNAVMAVATVRVEPHG